MITIDERWPRQPFIGLACAAVGGICLAEFWPRPALALAAAGVVALITLVRRSTFATYLCAAAAFCFLQSQRLTSSPGARLAHELGEAKQAITVRGVVVSEPKVGGRGTASFHLQLRSIEREGLTRPSRAKVLARWPGDVRYGDEVQLFGIIQPTDGPRNPGEFDMRAYLFRRDIRNVIVTRYPENGRILSRGGGNPFMRAAHRSRDWIQAALVRGLEDSPDVAGLISAMVLGQREGNTDEIEERFQHTGTIHLFAVAGLHVGIVAYLLWSITRAVRIPQRWSIVLIIPALFFYAAITGWNPSSVRAAIMAAVLLGGFFVDRPAPQGNTVAAAAFILLAIDSNQLFATGFLLSFAVVIAIIALSPWFNRRLISWCEPDPFLPRSLLSRRQRSGLAIWRRVAGAASVSIAAWIGSLPLILKYFYLITPVAIFANLVVVPIAFFVLACALMSALATPFAPALALVFNNANWGLARVILAVVDLLAHAPAGHYYVELPPWSSRPPLEMTVLDLGAGGAIHLRASPNEWLFDTGAERDFSRVLRSFLRARGVNRLDGLLLTHGDSQHIGAASLILQGFAPREILDNPAPDRSSVHRQLIFDLERAHLARKLVAAGDEWNLSREVRARVLFPPANFDGKIADDQALVTQLVIADRWRVLLMSDSGETTERWLLANIPDLRADVLVKGQHHSRKSGTPEFLERVQPRALIASSIEFPESERIQDDWAEAVNARGIKLFRQDETGAVRVRFDRERWEAIPYLRPGEILRSESR